MNADDRRRRAEWLKAKTYAEDNLWRKIMYRLVAALIFGIIAILVTSMTIPFMVMEIEIVVMILGIIVIASILAVMACLLWAFYFWRRLKSLLMSGQILEE